MNPSDINHEFPDVENSLIWADLNKITTESMSVYVGGQVEILGTSPNNRYRYRGQISKIEVKGDKLFGGPDDAILHVEFEYICEWDAGEFPTGYKPSENKPYDLSLLVCKISDIGDGRLCVNSEILNEMSLFYPPDHVKRVLENGDVEFPRDIFRAS